MPDTIDENGEILGAAGTALATMGHNQSLVATMLRAEIDTLITTARAYPRSIKRSVEMLKSIVTIDEQSALECIFALPRGGKPIRGASIRFAEACLQSWGNAMVQATVTHVDREEKVVIAEGSYRDLETNVMTRSTVRRRISDKNGRIFADDLIIVTGNAACSIARRNAILAGIPKPVWRGAYEAVEQTIAGTAQTLSARRDAAVKSFAMWGVKPELVFAALGVNGIEDVQLDHVLTMRGMYSAIKNEEATVEEVFNMRAAGARAEGVADALGDGKPKADQARVAAGTAGDYQAAQEMKADAKKVEAKAAAKKSEGEQVQATPEAKAGEGAPTASPEKDKPVVAHKDAASNDAGFDNGRDHPNKESSPPAKADLSSDKGEASGGDVGGEERGGHADGHQPSAAEATSPPKEPTNDGEYLAHVTAYIAGAKSAAALTDQWKSERKLRTAINVSTETFNELSAAVKAKTEELKAGTS